MKSKKLFALLISVLTFVSLALALIFSPLRSYYADNTMILNESKAISGVDLGRKIKNARNLKSYQSFSGNFLNIPSTRVNLSTRRGVKYSGGSTLNDDGSYLQMPNLTNPVSKSSNGVALNADGTSTGNQSSNFTGGFVNSSFLASNTDTKKSTTNPSKGFISTTTNLTSLQKAGTTKSNVNGGPPPDEGGSTPPPIPNLPIGNGMIIMLALSFVFGLLKFRRI